MGYPHHFQSMGINIEPKFPASDDYGFHNGYNNVSGITQNGNEYLHHAPSEIVPHNNGGNNGNNYNAYGMSGHYYHHHHHHHHHNGYASPVQMHQTASIPTPTVVQPSTPTSSSTPNENNGYVSSTYYPSYYNSSGHQPLMDVPLQCPGSEISNTALGLQELGKVLNLPVIIVLIVPYNEVKLINNLITEVYLSFAQI